MDPISATINCLTKPFRFAGRATRSEFWWFTLSYSLASMIGTIWLMWPFITMIMQMDPQVAGIDPSTMADAQVMGLMGGITSTSLWVFSIVSLWLMFSHLSVTVRRLHDSGRSGWWWWINLVPIVGPIILLILLVAPSETGRNDFGNPGGNKTSNTTGNTASAPRAKVIPRGLPGEPYNPINELTTSEELRALRASRMAN